MGADDVQQVVESMSHYDAHNAWIITNRSFLQEAKDLADTHNVRFTDRDGLIELIISLQQKNRGKNGTESLPTS